MTRPALRAAFLAVALAALALLARLLALGPPPAPPGRVPAAADGPWEDFDADRIAAGLDEDG